MDSKPAAMKNCLLPRPQSVLCNLLLLLLFWSTSAEAQVNFETRFPAKELLANWQKAKGPEERLRAAGVLAAHYKFNFKDSLAAVWLQTVREIAEASKQKSLMASALWWIAYLHTYSTLYSESQLGITKVNELLQYAEQNNLPEYKVAAGLFLSELSLHENVSRAERHVSAARQWFDQWKADSIRKDSVKLELYAALAHVYIHKKDGVNTTRYLLIAQDYAEQSRNIALKITAMRHLANFYQE
jgi:hypothetical protein